MPAAAHPRVGQALRLTALMSLLAFTAPARIVAQSLSETRDPRQAQDPEFAKRYAEWTSEPKYGSPLVDHLPVVKGIPTPREILGYDIGAPRKLTYYADMLRYYRALAAATPRVKVETIGRSDEGRELVVVWVSSDSNMAHLARNRANLARLADPRGLSDAQVQELLTTTRPHYHLMGGLHSGETGPSEMLMELVYRLATEDSPYITRIRNQVYVSVTPVADADGRDRNVDWFYYGLEAAARPAPADSGQRGSAGGAGGGTGFGGFGGRGGIGSLPYWGKYVFHDNNRDINLSLIQMRAIADWYFTAHPPIMHDLHEAMTLLYTYSGGPPQNPNLDPILFAELPWFSNFEMAEMTKWGMPGVYTHAFMDGWSPGYLGSIAYNHNGMMRMYETQSGRDPSPTPAAGQGARGGAGRAGAGAPAPATGRGAAPAPTGRGGAGAPPPGAGMPFGEGRGGGVPTGRGGTQEREWYRGLPVPSNAVATFTRRNNTNYMETAVLAALQLTARFPEVIVENFYIKTLHSIEEGRTKAPFAFVIPARPDMTRAAELVNILRIQGIEIGQLASPLKVGDSTFAAGSYVIKRDQPYGRLAKNLLEKQVYPDARLSTYDDSGWSMGLAMGVDVVPVDDSTILKAKVTPVTRAVIHGTETGKGTAGIAVAHFGSNNMIAFRYQLRNVAMQVAESSFTAGGTTFPAGSFVIAPTGDTAAVRAAIERNGLTAVTLDSMPRVPMHNANPPRIAIYSEWSNTQDLGWYRLTFDTFGIPYDLIFKERVKQGKLRDDYDVIIMAAQGISRQSVMRPAAARPQPYQQSEKYRFLGMYGSTPDMSGGFGQEGVDAFQDFLARGGTLIAAGSAVRFPIDFGWAHTVDVESVRGVNAQRPLVEAEIVHPENPVFYGYDRTTIAIKYVGNSVLRVGTADQGQVLGRYVGGDSSVLSGLMTGADSLKLKPFAVDLPGAYHGLGRVILFTNNPIYRWQNHGEFNMVFNAIINWDDVVKGK